MKAKAKSKPRSTKNAKYHAYTEYDKAQRALFQLLYGIGSNTYQEIGEAGAHNAFAKLCNMMRTHLSKKESAWEAICLANPNDNDSIGA